MISVELPKALYTVFSGPARYRGAYGGRGSAKSWGFARMAVVRAYERPRRILCARELQNSIKDSVHHLLAEQIDTLKLPGFQVGESFLRHANGSEFIFRGLRTNASEIKSMEGIDIAWVEEAQKVSDASWELLIPTIRAEGSEIWITFNPELKTDPTSQRFIETPPPDSKIIKINYDQNPWFPEELRKEMEHLKATNPESYKHIWEGEYKTSRGGNVVSSWSDANKDDIPYQPDRRFYLTCDFNVDPMCWALAYKLNIGGQNHYHYFDEIVLENTNIISAARELARRYKNHKAGIIITGDASGNTRTDGTPEPNQTRYDVLKKAMSDFGMTNFSLDAPAKNPPPESRIEVFNELVCNFQEHRRVKVDHKCKQIIHILENLKYIPGSDQIDMPTPQQIRLDNKLKFNRNDMFDAVSYLTWRYDPKIDAPKKKVQFVTQQFDPRK